MKSREWKDRIAGHVTTFSAYRTLLHQTLSIHIAADVSNMVAKTKDIDSKLNVLIAHLFVPKEDWEKAVAAKVREFSKSKDQKDIIADTKSLETLVDLTKESLSDAKDVQEGYHGPKEIRALPTEMDQLKKDLSLPLDTLCQRNEEMFELKLNFHTRQLQNTIENAAKFVVKSLSGPYDRLHNDVRILTNYEETLFS